MNVSYNWLKRYINLSLSPEQLSDLLTSIGLEVDGMETTDSIKGGLEGLVVGKVISCEAHPNSDHLHVTKVDVGAAEPLDIVCGAANVAAGQKVVVATVGTVLYDGDQMFKIKPSKLRGVPSNGMICAEDEIGVGNDHSGIIVLPDDVPVGTLAKDYYHVESDTCLEVDITPNRADGASHWGVARDLYAAINARGGKAELSKPSVDGFKVDEPGKGIEVEVVNQKACPRYSGVLIDGVTIAESPEWLKKALTSIGLNPINNVVDISNYILFGLGQPLHTFDADKIKGGKIVVRNCEEGTPFVTLDGVERKLSADDLMICNAEEPMCIAGVFGGLESGISDTTKRVFIESAWFNPVSIRKTARRHQLSTDASFRYERGTDPDGVIYALKRAAMLIKEVAGGRIASDIVDVYPQPVEPFDVKVSRKRCFSLIGKEIPEETLQTILRSLEMKVVSDNGDEMELKVPRYRVDVTREADVVEDVLRIYGYDKIELPGDNHTTVVYAIKPDRTKVMNIIGDMLASRGFQEIMNNTLTKSAYSDLLPQSCPQECNVALANPLSSDLNVLRQSLIFGALEVARLNRNHRSPNLKLFEMGNVQSIKAGGDKADYSNYNESYHLSLLMTGLKAEPNWNTAAKEVSFFDLKAEVNNVIARLGLSLSAIIEEPLHDDMFAEGLELKVDKSKTLVKYGIVNASVVSKFDIDAPVLFAEFDVPTLIAKSAQQNQIHYAPLPKYPSVKRDLALLVDTKVSFADVCRVARKTEKKILRNVSLFDVYQGKNLPAGKKSYAVSFVLRDDEKTLADKQIDKVMEQLTAAFAKELGAELR
ncbi:MAG: phenylalanine--tRNA ligase subunit beta [Marinilabiliaceae bacterium]